MRRLNQDLLFAVRTLRKAPAFLLVATLSLALGIGANTAIFTLIDQALLRPLPVKDPQQLVLLWTRGQHYGSNNGRYKISYPMYADFRDKNPVFSGMFSRYITDMSLSFAGRTERVQGEMVSGTYFPDLGIGPALGRVDHRILLFNLAISVLTCVAFGLAPALQSTKPDVAHTLKDQAGSISSGGAAILRKTLVAAQVMLSLLLLIAAGLFTRSLKNLRDLDPGFTTRHLLTFSVNPVMNGYKQEQTGEFYRALKQSLDSMPGVESSGLAVVPVLVGNEWDSSMTVAGYSGRDGPQPHMNYISPDYFRTMGIALVQGRDFAIQDDSKAPPVAIVNERFAKHFFDGRSALGGRIGMGGNPGTPTPIEIVGIARDTKYESMRDDIPFEVYIPYRQNTLFGMSAYVRTIGDPDRMMAQMRTAVTQIAPDLPVAFMKSVDAQLDESLLTERLVASLSTAFSLLATLLAAIGLYGVVAYTVGRRTRKIGIRVALGASRGNVIWLAMQEVAILTGAGVIAGLGAAWALTGLVRQQLYGLQPNDAPSLALATFSIAFVALTAGFLPAHRASRVDPLKSLRWE